jgi:hypothetical protein
LVDITCLSRQWDIVVSFRARLTSKVVACHILDGAVAVGKSSANTLVLRCQ